MKPSTTKTELRQLTQPRKVDSGGSRCRFSVKRLLLVCAVVLACGAIPGLAQSLPALLVDYSAGSQVRLSWTNTPGIIVLEEAETLTPPSVWQPVPQAPTLLDGRYSVMVNITGGRRFFRLHQIETGGLPPDPASIAPPPTQGVATPLAEATAFLYTGPNPIQTGVAPNTIDPRRAAVVRGRVNKRDNTPLSGVTISVLNHPEFGQTLSRADGLFDMAVNGGGLLTVKYEKTGFCSVQRQLKVPWQDYVMGQDVVMIQIDLITPVAMGINSPMQVARGSMQSDADGSRKATLLFMPGTSANLVLPNGATQNVTSLNVRATEFTVGANGPHAMPGELPPSSGYTYCVDLSADEAIAAGAKEVRFSSPVHFYVENFVGFPVGSLVPTGYYDRGKGQWVASDNGRVIKVISVAGGVAELDLDGNGTIDNAASLAALGISDDERQRLASLYTPGQELWRVLIPHFSPWDCNWPYGPPPNSELPGSGDPKPGPKPDKPLKGGPDEECGSIIGTEPQKLGEVIPVTGTPMSLHYQSDRVPGRAATHILKIRLSGATLPPGLLRIHLEITITGRTFRKDFAPLPNLLDTFTWDGKDAYGRPVQGQQPVLVRLGYEYLAQYYATVDSVVASFNRFGLPPIAAMNAGQVGFISVPARIPSVLLWQDYHALLGNLDGLTPIGGWNLSVHHAYDWGGQTLYLGNGEQRSATAMGPVIRTVAGMGVGGFAGDGGRATEDPLKSPWGLAVGSDGSLYIAEAYNNRIRRVGPDGIIATFAGTGVPGFGGDGGLATQAHLNSPIGIGLGPDGSLYIADLGNNRIRRVGSDDIITTVVGTGVSGLSGDGGLATEAQLKNPQGVAVGPDGSLYLSDQGIYSRIRRVGPDGIITTVAGGPVAGFAGDGGLATRALLNSPHGIAVGPDGSLYIVDGGNTRIRRMGPDGIITTVVATGDSGFSGDGGPATQARLTIPAGVVVGSDGALYLTDFNRVRRVGSDGIITTVAGIGVAGFSGDGGPPTQARLRSPGDLALGPDGSLYFVDRLNLRIRQRRSSLPGYFGGDILIAAEDGSEVYVFSDTGRHLRTLDALTGAVRFQFTYSNTGRLTAITDADGNLTTIERDGSGTPTAIVAPFGQRTTLAVNGDGSLSRVTNPAGEAVQLTYYSGNAGGLMATLTDPRGNRHQYTYDTLGRLIRDENPAGGVTILARTDITDEHYAVSLTTALGLVTTFEVEELSTGDTRRLRIDPGGARTESLLRSDGSRRVTYPDGTVADMVEGPDPRFGMQAPILTSLAVTTPGGITTSRSVTRLATLSDPTDLLSLTSQTDTVQVNGNTYTRVYNAATRTFTVTTPAGRQHSLTLDARGRRIQASVAGLTPVQLGYDSRGSLASLTQGDRAFTVAYDPQGFLSLVTDPLAHTVNFAYDAAGRTTRITRPDSETIQFAYDAGGNMASLTPPSRAAHTFTFTPVGLLQRYAPPAIPGIQTDQQFTYNLDRRLSRMVRADTVVNFACDAAGRLQTLTSPHDTVQATYDAASRLNTLATAGGIGLTYGYDGSLLTRTSWTGPVTGTVQRTFDNNRRVTGRTINGANAQTFTYDADGLLSQAGALTLQRNAQNGLLTGTALDVVSDTRSFNGFGEWTSYSAAAGATSLFSAQYTRDQAGRITQLAETIAGVTVTVAYSYDLVGRLIEVRKNGVSTSACTYDANGNRLTHTTAEGGTTGSYDAQDRLTQYGAMTFTYTANGDLLSATAGGQTTSYVYDVRGNLRSVTLPGGTQIEYLIDGRNRRIGKKFNGTNVQGFLYQNSLKPIAELDGNNTVISTFVYGSRINVPDYMVKGGSTYRIIADHLGSPRLIVDTATGAIAQQLDYDAFGNVQSDTSPGFQPFGFAGGLYDRDTRLVRFGARDYDPNAGRWTSKDASGLAGGINLYAYANGDPVNYLDLDGRSVSLAAPLAFGIATGGAVFIGTVAALGVTVAIGILSTASVLDSVEGDQTHDDEGESEGGAPPQDGEVDGGSKCPTPLVPPRTDQSPPPDEAIPDDFLINPKFPKPGPDPRIPVPYTPEGGFPHVGKDPYMNPWGLPQGGPWDPGW